MRMIYHCALIVIAYREKTLPLSSAIGEKYDAVGLKKSPGARPGFFR
jgi:hypothetical protein